MLVYNKYSYRAVSSDLPIDLMKAADIQMQDASVGESQGVVEGLQIDISQTRNFVTRLFVMLHSKGLLSNEEVLAILGTGWEEAA